MEGKTSEILQQRQPKPWPGTKSLGVNGVTKAVIACATQKATAW
jgi:hypothetical protein